MKTSMPSNIKFGKFALVVLVSLTGCASQRIAPSQDKLATFVPNCAMAQEQLDWLRSVRPTYREHQDARLETYAYGGFSRSYRTNKDLVDGRVDYLVDLNIKEIYYVCQLPKG